MKIGILLATGFEEGESLFLLDILRRANFDARIISMNEELLVKGSHDIQVICDELFSEEVYQYDMVILPGGLPGATNLRDDQRVINLLQYFNSQNKYIGAICAAPMVLQTAGILKGRTLTSYPGSKYENLFTESTYKQETVVIDDHLITSRGPATTLAFAYAIVDILGGDSASLKKGMLYLDIEK